MYIENCRNKSTTSSIRIAVPVFDIIECCCYTMVYSVNVTHLRNLLSSTKILSIFIEVRMLSSSRHSFIFWLLPKEEIFRVVFFLSLEFYSVSCPLTQFSSDEIESIQLE